MILDVIYETASHSKNYGQHSSYIVFFRCQSHHHSRCSSVAIGTHSSAIRVNVVDANAKGTHVREFGDCADLLFYFYLEHVGPTNHTLTQ
jgi:hypothetical protein